MISDDAHGEVLLEAAIPLNAKSTLDNLFAAFCTDEEFPDPERLQVNVGTNCNEEAAGFVAGAAATALAENTYTSSMKKVAVEEEWSAGGEIFGKFIVKVVYSIC